MPAQNGAKVLGRGAQMAAAFGKQYFRSPQLPPVDCCLVVEMLDGPSACLKGCAESGVQLPDFPENGSPVNHPILSTPHLKEWRNSLRILLHVDAYMLSIRSISLVAITEDKENTSKEIFNRDLAEIPRSEVVNFFAEHKNASRVEVVVKIKINQMSGDPLEKVPTTVPFNNGYIAVGENGVVFSPLLQNLTPAEQPSPTPAVLTSPPAQESTLYTAPFPHVISTPEAQASVAHSASISKSDSPHIPHSVHKLAPHSDLRPSLDQASAPKPTSPPMLSSTPTQRTEIALPQSVKDALAAARNVSAGGVTVPIPDPELLEELEKWFWGTPEPDALHDMESDSNLPEKFTDLDKTEDARQTARAEATRFARANRVAEAADIAAEEEIEANVEDEVVMDSEDETDQSDIAARLEQFEEASIDDWDLLKALTGVGNNEATDENEDEMELDR
ncbi:uncharacterized protein MYCGRDRAFT_94908 [Zymoseptoria tritici IPO323]|uniref:Uncharacterized protein n=1 Tax=Zymoseptoria tritici (strain CBS 115943 / IPO323) TaxID=336722 RepID=F9XI23_ZYMTI|nr:uncharacterized protein MYCGRDRAFT_94908 [Zymoseptoria tritici IPO323]EGP85504.1 hypothetical protein MYCGRDRAFT_94908 [Zymoseptoria tritici IPO323]